MSIVWQERDVEYFRKLGIDVSEHEPKSTRKGRIVGVFICAVSFGMVLYGLLRAGAWVLRLCGVNVTGI